LPSGNVFGCPVDTFGRTAMVTPMKIGQKSGRFGADVFAMKHDHFSKG